MPEPQTQGSRGGLSKLAAGLALILASALCGFALAAWLAGRAGVAEGQGLAAGAIVLGYGVLGGLGGAVLAIVAGRLLPPRAVRALSWVVMPLGALLLVSLLIALGRARSEMESHLEQAYRDLPPFRLELSPGPEVRGAAVGQFFADWSTREYQVVAAGRICNAPLSGEEAVSLLTALRAAEGVLYRDAAPCDDTGGPVVQGLRFRISEAQPPDTTGEVALNAACLLRHPELGAPSRAAARLLRARGIPESCRPL